MELELLHFLCFKLSTLPVDKGKPEFDPRATVCINFPGEVSSKYLKILMYPDVIIEAHLAPQVSRLSVSIADLGEKMPDPHQDHQVAVQSSTLKASKKTSIIIQINSYTLAEKITLTPPQSRVQNISNHWEPSASPSEQRVPSMQRYLWTILDVLDLAATKIPRACKNRTQNRTCLHNLRHIHVDIRRFYRAVLASWLEHTAIGSIRSCVRIYGPSDFRLQRCPR